ncbi:hypothetical protein SCA6_019773 [Theobroma cacao]
MCGGAIISDLIPPTRTRRLTADYLWPDLTKSGSKKRSGKRYSKPVIDLDDDFEADFQEFKDEETDADDFDDVDDVLADVKPFALSATKKPASAASGVKANSQKSLSRSNLSPVQPNLDQNFNYLSKPEQDYFDTMGFVEEKPPMDQFAYVDPPHVSEDVGLKPFAQSDNASLYFNSDQGSNSFDCSDFGWGEQGAKTPEISSILEASIESDEFVEDANPKKKLKPSSDNVTPIEDNSAKSLSDELLALDNQMKYFQMPFIEGNWDASIDAFLNGDATQDGGNPMDLWSFDDFPAMAEGVF